MPIFCLLSKVLVEVDLFALFQMMYTLINSNQKQNTRKISNAPIRYLGVLEYIDYISL